MKDTWCGTSGRVGHQKKVLTKRLKKKESGEIGKNKWNVGDRKVTGGGCSIKSLYGEKGKFGGKVPY